MDQRFQPDPQQQQYLAMPDGVNVVLGGASTGKTTCLAQRAAQLIASSEPPPAILVFTRSTASAQRFRRQLRAISANLPPSLFIGTITEFAAYFCRHAGAAVNGIAPHFTIWTPQQCAHWMQSIVDSIPPQQMPRQRGDHRRILAWHTYTRNTENPADYDAGHPMWLDAAAEYDRVRRRHQAMDPEDLVETMNNALVYQDDVRQSWAANRGQHVFIDDFQDLSPYQYQTVKLLLAEPTSLAVAADPNQSSNPAHAADPSLVNQLFEDFPEFAHTILYRNYRSTPNIVRTTEAFKTAATSPAISHDSQQAVRQRAESPRIHYYQEPAEVQDYLSQIIARHEISLGSLVFYCPHRRAISTVKTALDRARAAYGIFPDTPDDDPQLFQYLQLANNPDDAEALRQIVNAALDAGSNRQDHPTLEYILDLARQSDIDLIETVRIYAGHVGNTHLISQRLRTIAQLATQVEYLLQQDHLDLRQLLEATSRIVDQPQYPWNQTGRKIPPYLFNAADAVFTEPHDQLRDLCQRLIDRVDLGHSDPPLPSPETGIVVTTYEHAKSFQPHTTVLMEVAERNFPSDPRRDHDSEVAQSHRNFLNLIASPSDRLHLLAPADNPAALINLIHRTLATQ